MAVCLASITMLGSCWLVWLWRRWRMKIWRIRPLFRPVTCLKWSLRWWRSVIISRGKAKWYGAVARLGSVTKAWRWVCLKGREWRSGAKARLWSSAKAQIRRGAKGWWWWGSNQIRSGSKSGLWRGRDKARSVGSDRKARRRNGSSVVLNTYTHTRTHHSQTHVGRSYYSHHGIYV